MLQILDMTKIMSNVSSLIAAQDVKKHKFPIISGTLRNYILNGERSRSLTALD